MLHILSIRDLELTVLIVRERDIHKHTHTHQNDTLQFQKMLNIPSIRNLELAAPFVNERRQEVVTIGGQESCGIAEVSDRDISRTVALREDEVYTYVCMYDVNLSMYRCFERR